MPREILESLPTRNFGGRAGPVRELGHCPMVGVEEGAGGEGGGSVREWGASLIKHTAVASEADPWQKEAPRAPWAKTAQRPRPGAAVRHGQRARAEGARRDAPCVRQSAPLGESAQSYWHRDLGREATPDDGKCTLERA